MKSLHKRITAPRYNGVELAAGQAPGLHFKGHRTVIEDPNDGRSSARSIDTTEAIRAAAIDHHHNLSAWFEHSYKRLNEDRFANEFTYGRVKIDDQLKWLFASLPRGGAVLDVGCGTGEQLLLVQSCGLRAHGLEPAQGMRDIARRQVPDAEIAEGVATQLPFDDGAFDAVIQIEVLRYLHRAEIRQALREARRVLRPSGQILITLVNRWALDGFYLRQRSRQWRKGQDFDERNPHCEFFSPAEAVRELRDAGFVDVAVQGRMFAFLRPLWRIAPKVAARIARSIERFDDVVHNWQWTRPFAGHLIVTARVPDRVLKGS